MHRRFFPLHRCSQFMTGAQLQNLRLIYLQFFHWLFFVTEVFLFPAPSGINQSFENLFPVNSLNNLHRLRHQIDFPTTDYDTNKPFFVRKANDSCRHLKNDAWREQRSRQRKRNYLFKLRENVSSAKNGKSEFHGQLSREPD